MTIKICIDAGHGGYDAGAVNKITGLKEKDLTLAVAIRLKKLLLADGRFSVVMTREGDYAPKHLEGDTLGELKARASIANAFGADLMVSIHFNAFNGSAHGVEALDYNGQGIGRKVAQSLVDILAREEGLVNRGVKSTNKTFAVIRETICPAVITESAFIDNAEDIAKFDEANEWDKLAMYHYRAICAGFNLTPNSTPQPVSQKSQKALYRLLVANKQVGAYSVKDNAVKAGWDIYNNGNANVIMITPEGYKYTFHLHQDENPASHLIVKTPIMGNSIASAYQMACFARQKNPSFDYKIAEAYALIGAKYGIRSDIAFCQAIVETGWFKFSDGTAVKPEQHNYCGLGVTSKGEIGVSFETIEKGITAHIQHLFAYANAQPLPFNELIIDPRFKYVQRGIAPYWEDLNNRWAMNSRYSDLILKIYNDLLKFQIDEIAIALKVLQENQVIASPDYWMTYAREGQTPEGKWVAQLIINMANKLKGGV